MGDPEATGPGEYAIWVSEATPLGHQLVVEGISLIGNAAVDRLASLPPAPTLVLSHEARCECVLKLSAIHFYGGGWQRALSPPPPIAPPFLISTNLRLRVVYSGRVDVNLDPNIARWLPRRGTRLVSAFSADWFGVITVQRAGVLFPRTEYDLVAFSTEARRIAAGPVVSRRDGGELVGYVHPKPG